MNSSLVVTKVDTGAYASVINSDDLHKWFKNCSLMKADKNVRLITLDNVCTECSYDVRNKKCIKVNTSTTTTMELSTI